MKSIVATPAVLSLVGNLLNASVQFGAEIAHFVPRPDGSGYETFYQIGRQLQKGKPLEGEQVQAVIIGLEQLVDIRKGMDHLIKMGVHVRKIGEVRYMFRIVSVPPKLGVLVPLSERRPTIFIFVQKELEVME